MPVSSPSSGSGSSANQPAPKRRWLRAAAVPLLALGVGIIVGNNPFRPHSDNPDATARGYLRYKEILTAIDRDYVDSVDADGLTDYAVAQVLGRLDPHSVYIPARDRDQTDAFLQSAFDGVGLDFFMFRDTATVSQVSAGGPAEAAGLHPGDQLVRVGNDAVAGAHLSSTRLSQLLRGPRGSQVALGLLRQLVDVFDFQYLFGGAALSYVQHGHA